MNPWGILNDDAAFYLSDNYAHIISGLRGPFMRVFA